MPRLMAGSAGDGKEGGYGCSPELKVYNFCVYLLLILDFDIKWG